MYSNILIPTDGSEGAERAIEHGLELAEVYGSTVHALYVVEPVHTTEYGIEAIITAMESEGERATTDIAERGESRGIDVETAVRRGTPHKQILEYVGENDINLVVIGTHGRTGLDRYLLGSVTEKVVRLSDVPVLTVSIQSREER